MNDISLMMVGRIALAMAALAPTAACAEPADQAMPSGRDTTAKAAGVSLTTFVSRHEKTLLASDTDGDGKVSRAEFVAAARTGKADPAKRFPRIDVNGDGLLDKAEIDAMLSRRFKRQDANGDGMLDATERAATRARKGQNTGNGPES
jgi:hypothetical protein